MMSDDCKDFGTADLAMVGIVKWVLSSIWEVLGSPARETLAGFMHSYFCHRVGSVLIPKTVESRDLFMLSKLATQMSLNLGTSLRLSPRRVLAYCRTARMNIRLSNLIQPGARHKTLFPSITNVNASALFLILSSLFANFFCEAFLLLAAFNL